MGEMNNRIKDLDLSHGDNKKAKVSFASFAIGSHDHETDPPAFSPSRFDMSFLPNIVHAAIASYLTTKDMHSIMESSKWGRDVYGENIKMLTLEQDTAALVLDDYGDEKEEEDEDNDERQHQDDGKERDEPAVQPTLDLFTITSRRPNVTQLTIAADMVGALSSAMVDSLKKLQVLDIRRTEDPPESIQALCDALAGGLCPNLSKLVWQDDSLELPLGNAFRSRMKEGRGCCGLKSLEIEGGEGHLSRLFPLLSSGAFEALEELKIGTAYTHLPDTVEEDLVEWLSRTKASHLRTLILSTDPSSVVAALCSAGVALRLQTLRLGICNVNSIPLLSQAITQGSWLDLKELVISFSTASDIVRQLMPHLVDALGVGNTKLTTLKMRDDDALGGDGVLTVARMLGCGGCPLLEELDLSYNKMSDASMVELARALEGDAPCNTTLRRLYLRGCSISPLGMTQLAQAMGRGALPHIEVLNLGNSILYDGRNAHIGDDGVTALVQAMLTGGALRSLRNLNLDDVGMTEVGAKALFQAIGHLNPGPPLKTLNLGCNVLDNGGVVHLAGAVEAGALQQLEELRLESVAMREDGFKSLIRAVVAADQPSPGCPRLKLLDVGDNDIGGGGAMYLAEMMKMEGAMQHLRRINLNGTRPNGEGLVALFQALGESSNVCPNLRFIRLYDRDVTLKVSLLDRLLRETNAKRGHRFNSVRIDWGQDDDVDEKDDF